MYSLEVSIQESGFCVLAISSSKSSLSPAKQLNERSHSIRLLIFAQTLDLYIVPHYQVSSEREVNGLQVNGGGLTASLLKV